MNNTKKNDQPVHPVHHGHPAPDQAEGERGIIDQALENQARKDARNLEEEQRKLDRQRSGREQRRLPQTARQGKKVA